MGNQNRLIDLIYNNLQLAEGIEYDASKEVSRGGGQPSLFTQLLLALGPGQK